MNRITVRIAAVMVAFAAVLLLARGTWGRVGNEIKAGEEWYTISISGERCGLARFAVEIAEGRVVSRQEIVMKIRRMGVELGMELKSEFVETADEKPMSMRTEQMIGAGRVVTEYEFVEDGIISTTKGEVGGGGERVQKLPRSTEEWLTPVGVKRFAARMKAEGQESYTLKMMDPSVGAQVVTVNQKRVGPVKVTIEGKEVERVEWESEQSVMPGVKSRTVEGEGERLLRSVTPMMGMEMVLTLSTKEEARADKGSAELMEPMLLAPDKPLKNSRGSKRVVYVVRAKDGESLSDLPSVGAQTVERIDAGSARVTVDVGHWDGNWNEQDRNKYLLPSALVNSRSSCVDARTRETLEGVALEEGSLERAKILREFVASYMTGAGLDVGMAGADEVCRTKKGDCTEFAVLLAAMLRVADIPSRVVCGVVYCDRFANKKDVFGPHMWTQALVDRVGVKVWVDLDATLGPGERSFDGGHIAFSTSALSDDVATTASFIDLLPFLGKVRVEVEREE